MRLRPPSTLALTLALAAASASAQAPACPEGTAGATLSGTRVQARLYTNGNLFYGGQTTNGDGYFVPLGEYLDRPRSPIFMSNLWVGGVVGGEVRDTAARFTNFMFRPGRTGADHVPPSPAECAAADHIWMSTSPADLAAWPVHLGAPVLDGDGVPGNYNPAGGDRPAIRGSETAFWAMTDTATRTDSARADTTLPVPVGLDVTAEAFAFQSPSPLFGTTTVYRFTLTNRNDAPLDSAYVGWYMDPDLGNASDDYIGTDTTAHMAYVYNADDDDEGVNGYGAAPPAVGIVVAEGPVGLPNGRDDDGDGVVDEPGERLGMTAAPLVYKSMEPISRLQFYRTLRGLFRDGTPVRERGNGYGEQDGVPVTRFAFAGDPVAGTAWSEVNNGTASPFNPTGDRRLAASTGPFRLAPDSSATVTFAVVYGRGSSNLQSIRVLQSYARAFREAAQNGLLDAHPAESLPLPPPPEIGVSRPRPNPFASSASVVLRGPIGTTVRVAVLDALGRTVAVPHDGPLAGTEAVLALGAGLPPGLYLVRVSGNGFAETFSVVKAR